MSEQGHVNTRVTDGIAEVRFGHPRGNSLPGHILSELAAAIRNAGNDPAVRVVVLKSEGDKVFCGGASFDELSSIRETKSAHDFFMGFARVILAIRDCPRFVIARVQGKAVGGGVGVIAAADYAVAADTAAIRLSEFALGFGPFVISAAVQRKIGLAAFSTLTIDTEWRDASWARSAGLYAEVCSSISQLDVAVAGLATKLAKSNPAASARIKQVLWAGTESWPDLLSNRAQSSAELLCTDFVQSAIQSVQSKG